MPDSIRHPVSLNAARFRITSRNARSGMTNVTTYFVVFAGSTGFVAGCVVVTVVFVVVMTVEPGGTAVAGAGATTFAVSTGFGGSAAFD